MQRLRATLTAKDAELENMRGRIETVTELHPDNQAMVIALLQQDLAAKDAELVKLKTLIDRAVWFDYSECDDDVNEAISRLRLAVSAGLREG